MFCDVVVGLIRFEFAVWMGWWLVLVWLVCCGLLAGRFLAYLGWLLAYLQCWCLCFGEC